MASSQLGPSRGTANPTWDQVHGCHGRIRVLVADADRGIRVGLSALMMGQCGIHFVGTALDGLEAVCMVRRHPIDVVFMSLRLPKLDALEVAGIIRSIRPQTRVVVRAERADASQALRALACGISGFLRRDASDAQILDSIATAHRGGRYYAAFARSESSVPHAPGLARASSPGAGILTHRQEQVLRLLAFGLTDPQIAGALDLSVRAVESLRAHLQAQLGLDSTAALASFGLSYRG